MSEKKTVDFPSEEKQSQFLEAQMAEIRMTNFRNDVAKELYAKKMEIAKERGDKDSIRKYEEELEEIEKSDEGNTIYLDILKNRL